MRSGEMRTGFQSKRHCQQQQIIAHSDKATVESAKRLTKSKVFTEYVLLICYDCLTLWQHTPYISFTFYSVVEYAFDVVNAMHL